jgi:hypothetical protein
MVRRHSHALVHGLMIVVLFVALGNPLAVLRGGVNTQADWSQYSSIYQTEQQVGPRNPNLSDTTLAISPWLAESRRELLDLHLPVWNEYEGNGAPQLANAQTAVFSPFSVPIYVFGFRWGYLLAILMKVAVAYLGVVWLIRMFGGRLGAQSVAGCAYVLSGYMVVWLYWPLSSEAAIAPAVLWAFLATYRSQRRQLVAQAGAVAALAVAGHPETAAFIAVFVAVATLIVQRDRMRVGLRAARNVAIGLAASAVQVLPFVGYLRQSAVLAQPGVVRSLVLKPGFLLSAFDPNGLGRPPAKVAKAIEFTGLPNFNELLGSYVSPVAVLLGLVAIIVLWSTRRDKGTPLFRLRALLGATAIVWVLIWYDVLGIGTFVIRHIPAGAALNRAHPVFTLAICLLAGFGVEDLLGRMQPLPARHLRVAFVLVGLLLTGMWLAYPGFLRDHNGGGWLNGARLSITVPIACCLLAVSALWGLIRFNRLRHLRWRRACWIGLAGSVLIAPIYGFWRVNAVVNESLFYPTTTTLTTVRQVAGPDGIVLAIGAATTQANILSYSKIATPFLYDAINLDGHFQLVQALGGRAEYSGVFNITDIRSLNVFGVTELVTGVQDSWGALVSAGASTDIVRPGTTCAASPDPTCVDSVDGHSSAVVGPSDAAPTAGYEAMRHPAGLSLAAFDEHLAYFTVDASTGASFSPTCTSIAGVSAAVDYISEEPERALNIPAVDGACAPTADTGASARPLPRTATQNRYGGHDYDITGGNGNAGTVWIPQSYFSGWHASIDGHAVPIVRVNAAFVGVTVPAGWQIVRFTFMPRGVIIGLLVSLITIVGVAAYYVIDRIKSDRRQKRDVALFAVEDSRLGSEPAGE